MRDARAPALIKAAAGGNLGAICATRIQNFPIGAAPHLHAAAHWDYDKNRRMAVFKFHEF
jgi:hypothetical protein